MPKLEGQKRKPRKNEPDPEFDKQDYDGFRGGIDVNLKQKVELEDLETVLSRHIDEVLELEIKNQEERLEKISLWNSHFRGNREEKDYPFPNCANVAVPITRSNTDAIHVRLVDALLSQQKVWIFRAKKEEFIGLDRELEDAMDHYQKNILKLKKKLNSPLLQSTKIGFGAIKIVYENKTRTRYRYADKKELARKDVPKYHIPGSSSKVVKQVESIFKGPNIYPISREDWIASSDATCMEDAYLVGFRKYYRDTQLKVKVKKGFFYDSAVERMTAPGADKYDEQKEARAEAQKKEITQIQGREPYEVWELWLDYDVDGDGEPDSIVVTYHRQSKTILRCIYNPLFAGFRPFLSFVFYPSEYSLEGEGTCEILEGIQEEIDTLHNQRLDRLTQLNAPMIFVRAGAGIDDFELIPGKVTKIDGPLAGTIEEFAFHDVYYSTEREEDRLTALADRAIGITPSVMGQSTAERPVAKETFALIQEANKKFKYGIDNLRASLTELAYMLLEFFAQYSPEYKYKAPGTRSEGQFIEERTVNFPLELIRDGFQIDLAASSEMFNQEARREIAVAKYHLLSDYYTKMASVAEAVSSPIMPPPFKIWLLEASKKTEKAMEDILREFNDPSADSTVLSIDDVLDAEQLISMQPPPPPVEPGAEPPPGQPGAPGTMPGPMPGA